MSTQAVMTACDPAQRHEFAVADLIRALVDAIGPPCANAKPGAADAEDILIDVDVDGARYLFIRMPISERPQIQLSPREQEIVRMVALGHPNKVIAEVLNISTWTVCTHLRRIFAKAGVGSRAAMVARLFDRGKLDPSKPARQSRALATLNGETS